MTDETVWPARRHLRAAAIGGWTAAMLLALAVAAGASARPGRDGAAAGATAASPGPGSGAMRWRPGAGQAVSRTPASPAVLAGAAPAAHLAPCDIAGALCGHVNVPLDRDRPA